jgi:hypothetical protein
MAPRVVEVIAGIMNDPVRHFAHSLRSVA